MTTFNTSCKLPGSLGAPIFAMGAVTAQAEPRACLIVGVSDGDTLTARCGAEGAYEQIKVRLNGIDAPEKRQPFGEQANHAISDLAFGKVRSAAASRPIATGADRSLNTQRCRAGNGLDGDGVVVPRIRSRADG